VYFVTKARAPSSDFDKAYFACKLEGRWQPLERGHANPSKQATLVWNRCRLGKGDHTTGETSSETVRGGRDATGEAWEAAWDSPLRKGRRGCRRTEITGRQL